MNIRLLGVLAFVPWLAACISDSASWQIEGRDHALVLFRNQQLFWSSDVDLELVAARLPECQRRHKLGSAPVNATIEVFQLAPSEFLLRQGTRHYAVETRTCNGLQRLDSAPPGGTGARVGAFREVDGRLRFVADAKP